MSYGICNLSIVPVRVEPSDKSEMVSQLLFGEHFKILEIQKKWSKISISFDNYEGWIDTNQYLQLSEENYFEIEHSNCILAGELIDFATDINNHFLTIPLGAILPFYKDKNLKLGSINYRYDGEVFTGRQQKETLIAMATKFLNAPYLWGGKTPFGIDCSGFTQMVYKLCGHKLLRDAGQQATQGEALSFIEESEPGDLAFFDNEDGVIIHVGIIMKDNYIIHAHGKIRIDRIDHSGIFNVDSQRHTHKLRVIKKII
ncbi:MAG: C40 family peptidase [Lutibacter sp.]|nr:C40 family peptidase [Lutibacter sp.]